MPHPRPQTVLGQPSWHVGSTVVDVFVTRTGGQLAPITFRLDDREVQPMHVAPWAQEKLNPDTPDMLRALRGDFFCMPFGGNDAPHHGERHPPHGDTANLPWSFVSIGQQADTHTLHLRLDTRSRPGRVSKYVVLRDGHTAVYQRHVISGMTGAISLGHHAMLAFPDKPGSGLLATSPIALGRTTPVPFERPEQRGYSLLKVDAPFTRLDRVPTITNDVADLTRYPARRGFEDLVQIVTKPGRLAWNAVTFPRQRYAWFALRDPAVLPSTILWHSNGGRHAPPWNGRHLNVLGIEDVCSYFHYGLAESVKPNPLSRAGVPTTVRLDPRRPTVVNYIFGVVAVPASFRAVARIEPADATTGVRLTDTAGRSVTTPLDLSFLTGA